jgi:hypothetical protein
MSRRWDSYKDGVFAPGGRSTSGRKRAPPGPTADERIGNSAIVQILRAKRQASLEDVSPVSAPTQRRIEAQSATGSALDGPTRAQLEPALAADLSGVRVHDEPADHLLAADLGARGFTQGRDVFLGADARDDTLAHEATHAAQGRAGPGTIHRQVADPLATSDAFPSPLMESPLISYAPPVVVGPDVAPAPVAPGPVERPPLFETYEDEENNQTVAEEVSLELPEDPLADALPLRAALGDAAWQQLEAAALRRESLRRNQQVSYPEGNPTASVTVDDVLAPATYADRGDAAQVWSTLKGDAEPIDADQELARQWAVARAISTFRASVADFPAVVALVDPEAQEGGPSRLVLWVGGREVPLDQGLVDMSTLTEVAPQSLAALGDRAALDAITMIKAKTLVVQGPLQLEAIKGLADACEKDQAGTVIASLNQVQTVAYAIAFEASKLSIAAMPNLSPLQAELEALRSSAASTGARVESVISQVRAFQDDEMDVFGASIDEFWRRADDVFVVGDLISLFSAGDSRYRAQRLQAIRDGTISYAQFEAEMNGWKEYTSAGINIAMTVTAAKLAGPGATVVFGIDATWSPYLAAATRNVFASFATSAAKDVALGIALATTSSPDTRRFLESQIATPTDALLGAVPGMAVEMAAIRMTRPGRVPEISEVPPEPDGRGPGGGGGSHSEGGTAPPPPPPPQRRALDYPEDMQLDLAGNPADATKSGMGRTNGQINWRRYEQQRGRQNVSRPGLTDQTTTRLGRGERFEGARTQYSVRTDLSDQGATWFEDAKMRDFSNHPNVVDAAASIEKQIRAAELQLGPVGVMEAEFGIATTRQLPRKVHREIMKRVALWLRQEGYSTAEMNSFLERIVFTWALPK